jgi:hypothetical protein
MTDYIDGRLGPQEKERLAVHLKTCSRCRQLEKLLLKSAIRPFDNAKAYDVPEQLWSQIKDKIAEQEARNPIAGIYAQIIDILRLRKSKFAFATAAAILLITFIFMQPSTRNHNDINSYLKEQVDFVSYLNNGSEWKNNSDMDSSDFGTGVEKYFL